MTSKREQLINTATRLYAQNGFHNTGIDTILAEAGIAKRTLYNHFRTKNELILAVLRQHDSEFRNYFMRQVEAASEKPQDRLLAIFDVAEKWYAQNDFYGCLFINAIGEYSEAESALREVCREYKKLLRAYIADLAKEAGAKEPEELADALALLLEGATVTEQVSQTKNAAMIAKRVASELIAKAMK